MTLTCTGTLYFAMETSREKMQEAIDMWLTALTDSYNYMSCTKDSETPDITMEVYIHDDISQDDIERLLETARKNNCVINGFLTYSGDYEGGFDITDNVLKDLSSEECAIRNATDEDLILELTGRGYTITGNMPDNFEDHGRKCYHVCIEEHVSGEFEVFAENEAEAEAAAIEKYQSGEFVVCPDHVNARLIATAEAGEDYPEFSEF